MTEKERVSTYGLGMTLYLYQAIGVFVMLEMEQLSGGDWLADEMGLGKVSAVSVL